MCFKAISFKLERRTQGLPSYSPHQNALTQLHGVRTVLWERCLAPEGHTVPWWVTDGAGTQGTAVRPEAAGQPQALGPSQAPRPGSSAGVYTGPSLGMWGLVKRHTDNTGR